MTHSILCGPLCENPHMATNLAIDPKLLEEALEISGEKTKTQAVTVALQEFVMRRRRRKILELFGSMDWDPTYDYKSERSRS
jgi:Arc/MetJ family transcription regulator